MITSKSSKSSKSPLVHIARSDLQDSGTVIVGFLNPKRCVDRKIRNVEELCQLYDLDFSFPIWYLSYLQYKNLTTLLERLHL